MHKFQIDIHPATKLSEDSNLFFLIVSLISLDGNPIKLLQVVLENVSQIQWFIKNEDNIRNEELPFYVKKNCSIAEAIEQFYENIDSDLEESKLLDSTYNYRNHHGIRFAFRGQDIVDLYIGLNHGEYEISYLKGSLLFKYVVDIDSFFEQLKKAQKKYQSLINV